MLKDGDKLLARLKGLCPVCGADKQNYLETMGEPCFHGHSELRVLEQMGKDMVVEVDKTCSELDKAAKMLRLVLWKMGVNDGR